MGKNKTIHEFQRNSEETIRFSISQLSGHRFADIRIFYKVAVDDWRPTRKGVTVSLDLLDNLEEGIRKLREAVGDE